MDKDDYVSKMEAKLHYDATTYKELYEDPTPELQKDIATQNKLEQSASGEIDKIIHLKLRLTQSQIPRIHGHPKIHKPHIIQYRNY